MKRIVALVVLLVAGAAFGLEVKQSFTRADVPQIGTVYMKDVDFTSTQDITVKLPANLTYVLDGFYLRSKNVDTLSAGAVVTLAEVTSAGAAVQTIIPATTLASTDATGDVQDLTPASEWAQVPAYVLLRNVATATTSGAIGQITSTAITNASTVTTGLTNPATPRNIVLTLTDAAGTNLAGTVTVTGTDWAGRTVSEAHTVVTGTVSYAGSQPFRTLTSVAYDFTTNSATGDTLDIGYGTKLGLPYNADRQGNLAVQKVEVFGAESVSLTSLTFTNVVGTSTNVYNVYTNAAATATPASGTMEAAAASSATYGTFTATTAPNGSRSYGVYYSTTGPARPDFISGSNRLKFSVTGSTATNDTKDVLLRLMAW